MYSIKLNRLAVFIIPLLSLLIILGCTIETQKETYYVRETSKNVKINGKGTERAWKGANSLKAFSSPWDNTPIQKTEFKSLYDDEKFYFLFEVQDDDIVSEKKKNGEEENVLYSDRVELFFSANRDMNPYVTLEMDAEGRLFDAAGTIPGMVDRKWNYPSDEIKLKADKQKYGYSVEGSITLSSMREIGLLRTDTLYCGVMRAEYKAGKKAQWITWINTETRKANFHHPNIFGRFLLQ